MKKSLALALLLACSWSHIYGAEVATDETAARVDATADAPAPAPARKAARTPVRVFNEIDSQLAKLYPGTLLGFEKVVKAVEASDIISIIRAIKTDITLVSLEDFKARAEYYCDNFSKFMDDLKEKVKPTAKNTEDYRKLWRNIKTEAEKAKTADPRELDWSTIEVLYIRGLLLASGSGSDEARDLLSGIPEMELFFGALTPTPAHLTDKEGLPAWQHSSTACIFNSNEIKRKGQSAHKPSLEVYPLHFEMIGLIKAASKRLGLPEKVYLPMVDSGKIGITTLLKMLLNHVFPLPLTYDEYNAHGIALGSAVGAMHDGAHGIADNRRREVNQAIANLLKKAAAAGMNPKKALELAAKQMTERHNFFSQTLLAYVEAKQRKAIAALTAAITLAPTDAKNAERKAAESEARQEYNRGVAGLFEALHEEYAMSAEVLEAPTLAAAIGRLCENAKKDTTTAKFNELETFFNPESDLSDSEIFTKIRSFPVTKAGVILVTTGGAPVPTTTIGDYFAANKFDLATLKISRGEVYTEITFDEIATGRLIKIRLQTGKYAVNTAKDTNAVLNLVGKKTMLMVSDSEIERLRVLPKDHQDRAYALKLVQAWLTEVSERSNSMIDALKADVLVHAPAESISAYNELVAAQNSEWPASVLYTVVASSTSGSAPTHAEISTLAQAAGRAEALVIESMARSTVDMHNPEMVKLALSMKPPS